MASLLRAGLQNRWPAPSRCQVTKSSSWESRPPLAARGNSSLAEGGLTGISRSPMQAEEV